MKQNELASHLRVVALNKAQYSVFKKMDPNLWNFLFERLFVPVGERMIAGHICDEMKAEGIKFGG